MVQPHAKLCAMTSMRASRPNLLIVDDHAGMRDIIHQMLRGIVGEVRECGSGEEAVLLCDYFAPDCVTVDLRMAGMSGFATVAQIRAAHPQAFIVVVTQLDAEVLRDKAREAGADAYVCKDDLSPLRHLACGWRANLN